MQCRAGYVVQATDTFRFLRADGEGGVIETYQFNAAMPFSSAEAALEAIEDHCSGRGVVCRVWIPEAH